jgi:serine/threonine-protein kinase
LAWYHLGDLDRAVADATEAIRLDPADALAFNNRGAALLKLGDYPWAIADLQEALRLDPELPHPHKNLAWLRATCPDPEFRHGPAAVANATRALEMTDWKHPEWLAVLAAAHAEAGDFEEAVRWQRQCLDQSPAKEKARLQETLEQYQAGQPFRHQPAGRSAAKAT